MGGEEEHDMWQIFHPRRNKINVHTDKRSI
jgi:hypothetical protein